MALLSLSLQAVYDTAGFRTTGARLYVFSAGTTTPAPAYTEPTYANAHPHPIELRGNGTWPVMYLPAGSYRLRVTDLGDEVLDEVSLYRVEPENDEDLDPTIDDARLAQTGDIKDRYGAGVHPRWVRCNGRTIGSEASNATERANDDCEALFLYLWNQDANLAVSGGRGPNAATDWADAKTIALPDMRGRSRFTLDDLGTTPAGRLNGGLFAFGNATTLGSYGGEASHVQTVAELASHQHTATATMGQAGSHSHSGTTSLDGSHFHEVPYTIFYVYNTSGSTIGVAAVGISGANQNGFTQAVPSHSHTFTTAASGAHIHPITVSVATNGSSEAMNWLPPFLLVSTYIKL